MSNVCDRCGRPADAMRGASITLSNAHKVVYAWNSQGCYCAGCAGRLVEQLREGMPFPDRFDGASRDAVVAAELTVIEDGLR